MTDRNAELLRERGLRVTTPRRAVLAILEEPVHLTADEIATKVREAAGSVSTQAIYDVVHTLTAVGLLRRIEPAGSSARYERRVGDNHHHVICRRCGVVGDVSCVTGIAPCLDPSEIPDGFAVDEAEVVFWGICGACRTTVRRSERQEEGSDRET